jgi:hypothetical protein
MKRVLDVVVETRVQIEVSADDATRLDELERQAIQGLEDGRSAMFESSTFTGTGFYSWLPRARCKRKVGIIRRKAGK